MPLSLIHVLTIYLCTYTIPFPLPTCDRSLTTTIVGDIFICQFIMNLSIQKDNDRFHGMNEKRLITKLFICGRWQSDYLTRNRSNNSTNESNFFVSQESCDLNAINDDDGVVLSEWKDALRSLQIVRTPARLPVANLEFNWFAIFRKEIRTMLRIEWR